MAGNESTAIGTPVSSDTNKSVVKSRIEKIRTAVLTAEEVYYSFRDDIEESLQGIKL